MIEALAETQQMLAEQATIEKTKKKNNKRKRSEVLENGKENGYIKNGEADDALLQKKKKKKSKVAINA